MIHPVPKPQPKKRTRGIKRFKDLRDPQYTAFIQSLPCILRKEHICGGMVQACHLRSRGAGHGDYGNEFPCCVAGHSQQHLWGIRYWATYWFGETGYLVLKKRVEEDYPELYIKAVKRGWGKPPTPR